MSHLLQSLAGRAQLITPGKAADIVSVLTRRMSVNVNLAGVDFEDVADRHFAVSERKPYRITPEGVAIIPVDGTLMHRTESLRPDSGSTGYDGLRVNMRAAAKDGRVKGAVLDVNSHGGHVAGCADVADLFHAFAQQKPLLAIVDCSAHSAAYWLASQATRIVAMRDGDVGSIGAAWVHISQKEKLEKEGLKVSILHSGAFKKDGNPAEDLPDRLAEKVKAELDAIRAEFAAMVARGRGSRFTVEAAMATEARSYGAAEALEMGLIDAILPPDQALAEFTDSLKPRIGRGNSGGAAMADENTSGDGPTADAQAAVIAERGRIKDINAAATAQPALAAVLVEQGADATAATAMLNAAAADMSAATEALTAELETANSALAEAKTALEAAQSQGGKGVLAAALGTVEQPDVDSDGGDAEPKKGAAALTDKQRRSAAAMIGGR